MVKHKFNAKPTTVENKRFASKKEADYYRWLMWHRQFGELLFFLRQVPFDLPGNVKYFVDFVEYWADGEVAFSDVKGAVTPLFNVKKKMVEELYPIKINIVTEIPLLSFRGRPDAE